MYRQENETKEALDNAREKINVVTQLKSGTTRYCYLCGSGQGGEYRSNKFRLEVVS
ncbi:MAG: hypothetical protein R3Y28_08760 [Candidatus Gastranaerophilales bacterium]